MSHNHQHGSGGGCCHSNEDHVDPSNLGVLYSLFSKIDLNNLTTLNESIENSGRTVFRSWDDRLSKDQWVVSDCDDELLFNIPFSGNVKLKGIILIGGEDELHPARLRIFKNKGYMSFDDVKCEADQEFELMRDTTGTMEYPVKIVKFSSVYNLTLHIPKSQGGDVTKIYYIGLRGEFTEGQRDQIVLASYELAANPSDIHMKSDKKTTISIVMNPLVHPPIDKWSTREKLALASCVLTAGDQNWYSVSRSLKPFGELNRPNDWFAQKNCAIQYGELLENVETPKRKRGEKSEDTAQNLIVRKLTMERIKELKESIELDEQELADLKKNINLLKNDNLSETDQKIIEKQMLDALVKEKNDEDAYLLWLKERDEKYASISRKKSIVAIKTPRKDDSQTAAPYTPTKSTPTIVNQPSTPSSLVSQPISDDLPIDTSRDAFVTNDQQQLLIKQEKLNVQQEQLNEQQTTTKMITREKSKEFKDTDKVQVVVLNDDKRQANEKSIESAAKDDKISEKQSKDKQVEATSKVSDKIEATVVQPPMKMEVDNVEFTNNIVSQKNVVRIVEDERSGDSETREDNESITSNKRKRPSTSISLSTATTITAANSPAVVQQTPTNTPTTRRSGRLNPLRSSNNSKADQSISIEQSQPQTPITIKKQLPNITDEKQQPINASQLMFNDESTKDSTTSDLTDTYTSPNSPASSILNIDPNDPEQMKEQKEFKAWKKSILLLWREIATHKSTLFTSPVTDDEAKGYSTIVFRPIDLTTIRKKIENNEMRTTVEFQRDILLMFQNAIMYNSVKHEVHKMTLEMQKEVLESIEDFISNQKSITTLPQSSKDTPSSRRKSNFSSSRT